MATVYEIIQGLSQAAANAYDGALDENGEALEVGLQREEGRPLLDKRVMDGFSVRCYGDMMCLSYHSEVTLKEVYSKGFESEIEQRMSDIISFLKKEYRKITKSSVSLTNEGEIDIRVENTSRVRSWVVAKMHYKIGTMAEEMVVGAPSTDTLDSKWKTFLDQGDLGKRPKNDTRPKNSGE